MRTLVIMIAASAAILFLILTGWSASAVTGPGPSKAPPDANWPVRSSARTHSSLQPLAMLVRSLL